MFVVRSDGFSTVPFYLFALMYGLGLGASVVALPLVVAQCFGLLRYGRILGAILGGLGIGAVLGPPVAGKTYDVTGSYETAYLLLLFAFIAISVLAVAIQPERLQHQFERASA
jgi:MFS family permease